MILFGEIGCFLRGKVQLHGREDVTKVVTKLLCKRKGFPGGSSVKNPLANAGHSSLTPVVKIPWRRKRQPTPVFLPGQSKGQSSLVSYCPWGSQKSQIPLSNLTTTSARGGGRFLQLSLMRWGGVMSGKAPGSGDRKGESRRVAAKEMQETEESACVSGLLWGLFVWVSWVISDFLES